MKSLIHSQTSLTKFKNELVISFHTIWNIKLLILAGTIVNFISRRGLDGKLYSITRWQMKYGSSLKQSKYCRTISNIINGVTAANWTANGAWDKCAAYQCMNDIEMYGANLIKYHLALKVGRGFRFPFSVCYAIVPNWSTGHIYTYFRVASLALTQRTMWHISNYGCYQLKILDVITAIQTPCAKFGVEYSQI